MKQSSEFTLGLKLWSCNRNYYEEAKRLAAQGFCDYIELYAVPGTYDEFGTLWQSVDIPYIIHAPHFMHGMNLARPECQETNERLAAEAFAFADALDAKYVIFHPGINGDEAETIRQLNSWSDERKKRILIENKPYYSIHKPPLVCNGHSPAAIRRIMEETGVGFCFDIGHGICSANGRGLDPFEDLVSYEALCPTMYHIADNDVTSSVDEHKHLGEGNYDFARIFNLIDMTKPISIETDKSSDISLADFEDDVRFLKKRHYEFSISPAQLDDMRAVYELANEPSVRANSISTEPIPWETHQNWYQKKIADANVRFYLVRNLENSVCGYVRYDFDSKEEKWYVSIAFFPQYRGRGLGTWAMKRTEMLLRQSSAHPLVYLTRADNTASINMAQGVGFCQDSQNRGGGAVSCVPEICRGALNRSNYYSQEELQTLGFQTFGRDVLISRKACIYGAENMSFGDNIRIDDFVILAGKIELGSHIHIGAMSYLSGGTQGIFMEDFTGIAPKNYLTTTSDDYSGEYLFGPIIPAEFKKIKEGPIILRIYSIVGAGSIIMPGVCLAEGTAVGAMSFVHRSTKPWATYFGIPAKAIGIRSKGIIERSKDFLEQWNKHQ